MELSPPAAELRSGAGASSIGACFFPLYQSFETYEALSKRAAAAACNISPSGMFPTFQCQEAAVPAIQKAAAAAMAAERPHLIRKRKVLPNDEQTRSLSNPANYAALSLADLSQTKAPSTSIPAIHNNKVSTGLRLASFDEDASTATISRLETGSVCGFDELGTQLLRRQSELQQLFNMHAEQLKNSLKERTRMHSQALLTTVENEASKRLRERDAELDQVKRRCSELEDRIKHLTLETYAWQSKARSYEGMVTVLRANLQQAILHQGREQIKLEGCGNNDVDDAASAHIDENPDAQQTRVMMIRERRAVVLRACKKCQAKEVTILLLPCMHLCLCHDCKEDVESCPLCATPRSAFIEVYLS